MIKILGTEDGEIIQVKGYKLNYTLMGYTFAVVHDYYGSEMWVIVCVETGTAISRRRFKCRMEALRWLYNRTNEQKIEILSKIVKGE